MNEEQPGGKRFGDPEVDRAWRAASNEEPPPQLDAAILSAARSRRAHPRAWQPLAAVATVAGLAFVLVQLMPRERNVEAPLRIETAPSAAGAREDAKAAAETVAPSVLPATPPVVATDRAQVSRQSAPEADVAAPPDEQQARDAAGTPEAPSPPAAFSAEATAGNALRESVPESAAQMSPGQWSARIESFYRSGDLDAAESALREFRSAYADADQYLPPELRDWASSIK